MVPPPTTHLLLRLLLHHARLEATGRGKRKMRRTFVSMTWTPEVPADDARLLVRRVEDIYDLLRGSLGVPGQFDPLPNVRVFGAWELADSSGLSAYQGIDWILKRAISDEGDHILASRYLQLIRLEPWQATQPHFDLCLTDLPLDEDREDFPAAREVPGFSRRGLVSLISTSPFRHVAMHSLRRLGLQQVYAHYLGQMFDAPAPQRANTEIVEGSVYCTNLCAMRYTPSPERAIAFGQELAREGAIFCPACQYDLVARITSYHYGVN